LIGPYLHPVSRFSASQLSWLCSGVAPASAPRTPLRALDFCHSGASSQGGWLLSPLLGAGTVHQGDFSLLGLLVSFGGAIILLFVVNLLRRGAAR
jgi:hypothetical protein